MMTKCLQDSYVYYSASVPTLRFMQSSCRGPSRISHEITCEYERANRQAAACNIFRKAIIVATLLGSHFCTRSPTCSRQIKYRVFVYYAGLTRVPFVMHLRLPYSMTDFPRRNLEIKAHEFRDQLILSNSVN
jgi:hypothetical protein